MANEEKKAQDEAQLEAQPKQEVAQEATQEEVLPKQETTEEQPKAKPEGPKRRRIVLETDGNNVFVTTNETSGNLELSAVLVKILEILNKQ